MSRFLYKFGNKLYVVIIRNYYVVLWYHQEGVSLQYNLSGDIRLRQLPPHAPTRLWQSRGFHGVDDCRDDYDYDYDRGYESGLGFREELDEEFDYDDTPGYYDRFGNGFDSDGFDDGFADGFGHDDDL